MVLRIQGGLVGVYNGRKTRVCFVLRLQDESMDDGRKGAVNGFGALIALG